MTENPKSYSGTASLYDQITGLYDIDTNSYADKQQFFGWNHFVNNQSSS